MAKVSVFNKGFLEGYSPFIITSEFGAPREKIVHHGVDIGCPSGTKLVAPIDGTIWSVKVNQNAYGLYIILRHYMTVDSYLDIYFAHLHTRSSSITKGVHVEAGTFLGTTGGASGDVNAGRSTGAHLHLEIRKNGTVPINPMPFLYKEKCIVKTNKKILNYGTYEEGFKYNLTNEDFLSISSVKPNGKDTTDWSATEPIVKNKKRTPMDAKERLAPGVWQIVKLLIDSSVENKQVLDSGISVQQGSLINFFRKVCQEPLVEFMGDTYGDQFYLIVRRPPFDREGFNRQLELTTIEIQSDDIISTNLTWANQGIYSWYQYMPTADLLGIKEGNLFIPAVFFPEYAAIWGSRPLCVESNYYNFLYSGRWNSDKPENKQNGDRIMQNAIRDFRFLVESNAYTPFTRQGTIVIQGDRRIKKGTLISMPSGEVFYVDTVTNSYEVNIQGVTRTTTLNVSRGMYANFMTKKNIGDKSYSYFDIIDFGETKPEDITSKNYKDSLSKWKVNLDVFGFFMRREQVFWNQIYVNKQK